MNARLKLIIKSIAKKIAYVLAGLIIVAAVLVVTSRAMIPLLDEHKADFEKYASQLLESPVTIDKVRLSWYQYEPVITLRRVTINKKETNEPALQVKSIRLFVSIPRSIWNWEFVLGGMMITGLDVNIEKDAEGQLKVVGFPSIGGFDQQPFDQETKFKDVMAWLSAQPRLILSEIDLHYVGMNDQKRFVTPSTWVLSVSANGIVNCRFKAMGPCNSTPRNILPMVLSSGLACINLIASEKSAVILSSVLIDKTCGLSAPKYGMVPCTLPIGIAPSFALSRSTVIERRKKVRSALMRCSCGQSGAKRKSIFLTRPVIKNLCSGLSNGKSTRGPCKTKLPASTLPAKNALLNQSDNSLSKILSGK